MLEALLGFVDWSPGLFFQTSSGLINVFIEPQFRDLISEPLYTVQTSSAKTFQEMELPAFAEHQINLFGADFLFTGFAYSWHLEHLLSESQILSIPELEADVSPRPLSFAWVGQITDWGDDETLFGDDPSEGTTLVGYCLHGEQAKVILRNQNVLESVLFYPMFRLPSTSDLATVWTH